MRCLPAGWPATTAAARTGLGSGPLCASSVASTDSTAGLDHRPGRGLVTVALHDGTESGRSDLKQIGVGETCRFQDLLVDPETATDSPLPPQASRRRSGCAAWVLTRCRCPSRSGRSRPSDMPPPTPGRTMVDTCQRIAIHDVTGSRCEAKSVDGRGLHARGDDPCCGDLVQLPSRRGADARHRDGHRGSDDGDDPPPDASRALGAGKEQAADGRAVVFWKPTCSYCTRLRKAFGDDNRIVWVNVWVDLLANREVRRHNGGDEYTPTALVGNRVLRNPTAAELQSALR